jgi:hypothetical protein
VIFAKTRVALRKSEKKRSLIEICQPRFDGGGGAFEDKMDGFDLGTQDAVHKIADSVAGKKETVERTTL